MVPEDGRAERVGGFETIDPLSALNEECVRTVQYFRGFAVNFFWQTVLKSASMFETQNNSELTHTP